MTHSEPKPVIWSLFLLLTTQVYGACDVNTTIITIQENVPVGTVFMRLPRVSGEQWSFREDDQQGYIELNATENSVIFFFAKTPDLEELSMQKSSTHVALPFTLECSFDGWKHVFKQSIVLMDVNDNDPVFHPDRATTITVNENTSSGMPVLQLEDYATDPDVSGYVTAYDVTQHEDLEKDGSDYFTVSGNGKELVIRRPLDFDRMRSYGRTFFLLNITAMDNGYPVQRKAYATLQVNVSDSDDQGPAFVYADCPVIKGFCTTPLYETVAQKSFTGELRVWPGPVRAMDRDSINNTILFYIVKVLPEIYNDNFMMDAVTGKIEVTKPFESENIDAIHITIKAEENSLNRRFLTTTLRVQVVGDYYANYKNSFRNVPVNEVIMAEDGILRTLSSSSSSFFHDHSSSRGLQAPNSVGRVPISLFIATVAVFFVIIVGFPFVMIRVIKGKVHASTETDPSSSSGAMSLQLNSSSPRRLGLRSQDGGIDISSGGGSSRKESSDSTTTSVLTCVSNDTCTTSLYGPSRLYNDSDASSTSSAESTSTSSSTSSPLTSRMLSPSGRGAASSLHRDGCYDDSENVCSVSFPINPAEDDPGNRISSVSFDPDEVSSRFDVCHSFPPMPTRQDVSAAERLRRRFSRLFSLFHKRAINKRDNTRQKARVRFDIRNLSNFS